MFKSKTSKSKQKEIEHLFNDVQQVIADDLRFKKQLNIGEDVYTSMKAKKTTADIIDFGGGAITGAGFASSNFVATTFFSGSGLMSMLGLTTAVTPVGWVIAIAFLGGGVSVLFNKLLRNNDEGTYKIPKFINSQIDVLGVELYEQMIPLVIYVAADEKDIQPNIKSDILEYFVEEWGYSEEYALSAFDLMFSQRANDLKTISNFCASIVTYKKMNPDCNEKKMVENFIEFLGETASEDAEGQSKFEFLSHQLSKDLKSFSFKHKLLDSILNRFMKK